MSDDNTSLLRALRIHPPYPPPSTSYPSVARPRVRPRMCPRVGSVRPTVFIRTARGASSIFDGPCGIHVEPPTLRLYKIPSRGQRKREVAANFPADTRPPVCSSCPPNPFVLLQIRLGPCSRFPSITKSCHGRRRRSRIVVVFFALAYKCERRFTPLAFGDVRNPPLVLPELNMSDRSVPDRIVQMHQQQTRRATTKRHCSTPSKYTRLTHRR